jgi:hypothetical protein
MVESSFSFIVVLKKESIPQQRGSNDILYYETVGVDKIAERYLL